MPKVARMVVSGSRPSSGRSVTICIAAPSSATISVASTSASQKLPVVASTMHADIGAEHEQLAVGEVHHVHDAEDQRQAGGDQRQDHAGDDAVDRLDDDADPREWLQGHCHAHTPRYCWMTRIVHLELGGSAWWRTAPFSMM